MRSNLALFARGAGPRPQAPQGPGSRRGRAGGRTSGPGYVLYLRYFRVPGTSTHPASDPPCPWAGPAPCGRWSAGGLLEQSGLAGCTTPVYPPVLPTRYTRLGTGQGEVDRCRTHCRALRGTTGTCTYGRFGPVIGEPRGVEYRGVSSGKPEHHTPCTQAPRRALLYEVSLRFP